MIDYIITIPKTIKWEDYEKEIEVVQDWSHVMRYRAPFLLKESAMGQRCYVVYDGRVRGWMEITNVFKSAGEWRCSTSGKMWPAGNYIERSGPFHLVDGPEMRGFQGVRRYNGNV